MRPWTLAALLPASIFGQVRTNVLRHLRDSTHGKQCRTFAIYEEVITG
jgi:hypothetical protein